jgi:alpha-beta hydrolase superfamily lysophospholipase
MKTLLINFLFLIAGAFSLTACTSLYYFPDHYEYPYVKAEARPPEEMRFSSRDGTSLAAWHFSPDSARCPAARGLVLHYHGNAQNLSSHYQMLRWLTDECYEYYIFDYRGYGKSAGEKNASGILLDARSALAYFSKIALEKKLPFIVYGQSIGGSLLLRSLQLEGKPAGLAAVVIESSFYRYSQIGREKLSAFWLTWPLQWLTYLLVSDEASPGGRDFSFLKGTPVLLIYSDHDFIVPVHHGRELFAELPEPKWLWVHPHPGHINSMFVESGAYRKRLVQWLNWIHLN